MAQRKQVSPEPPGKPFLRDARDRLKGWWKELPFTAVKKLTDWKTLALLAACIAYIWPITYGWVVNSLPKSYYFVGVIKHRSDGYHVNPWSIHLTEVDNASDAEKYNGLRKSIGSIVRLPDDSYIPARSGAGVSFPEDFGRQWNGGRCLQIKNVYLTPTETDANNRVFSTGRTALEINRTSFKETCDFDAVGKKCPAFTIWAYGTPVPCFVL